MERDVPGAAPLQLVSWNVAGWASMHELVRRHYSGFEDFLERESSDQRPRDPSTEQTLRTVGYDSLVNLSN